VTRRPSKNQHRQLQREAFADTIELSNSGTLAALSRATDKPFQSSAQNFEDVVLWRVLQGVGKGCYVDVGAFDPVADSVSWSFYEQGWRGVVIEPVPALAARLRQRRPEDITIEAAAGKESGTATLFASESTGNSTLLPDVADRVAASGIEFSEATVRVARLDELLEGAGLDGTRIHFCTIDVEGSEADVVAGFNLRRWRPWILVIEATEPNLPRSSHQAWEEHVLEAGYRFCLFDGINRFYVRADKADDFAGTLSYPACAFDGPFLRAVSAARRADEFERAASQASSRADEFERAASQASSRADEFERAASQASSRADELERIAYRTTHRVSELEEIASRASRLERENGELANLVDEVAAELGAMRATVSWRVTRPLRAVRGTHVRLARRRENTASHELDERFPAAVHRDLELAFARRLAQAAETLCVETALGTSLDVDEALAALGEALTSSSAPDPAKAWLSLVAVDGAFPDERTVERVARLLRMDGPRGVREELLLRFAHRVRDGLAPTTQLDVRHDEVIVDLTHTVAARDLHTGIQRVVRETVSRWIDASRPMALVRLDLHPPRARLLTDEECERIRNWRSYVVASAPPTPDHVATRSGNTLVPWQCRLVIPELPLEPERTSVYRGLAKSLVLRSLSLVGFDLIPIVASETAETGMTADFVGYLSVVKHADRVSTISRTSTASFEAFATMAAAEGLRPPRVETHELPAEAPQLDPARVEAVRTALGIRTDPVILVVGSHEPRKNHLAVLEAAERLWTGSRRTFQLVFLGWRGWLGEEFDDLVHKLICAGRPIIVRKGCSEEELWAGYRLARFTVFPSLVEGFGLPVAESLASGTPVITSNHGSTAEVAEKGGCLLVNPRDLGELERAMALLLDDDEVLGKLRDEALRIDTGTWDSHARRLWDFLTEETDGQPLERGA
jgi:FkbM family methyltransferase